MCVALKISRSPSISQMPPVSCFLWFCCILRTHKGPTHRNACVCTDIHMPSESQHLSLFYHFLAMIFFLRSLLILSSHLPFLFMFAVSWHQESLNVCLFFSLLKCLPSLLVWEIEHPLSSSPFLTFFTLSLSQSFCSFPSSFLMCFSSAPLTFHSNLLPLSLFACLAQHAILSICLVFLLLRAHLGAVSCNSVVTLTVISNSLYTSLSISTPSPGNSVTYANIVVVDNPVRFITVRLIHHKGSPMLLQFFWILFTVCFFSLRYLNALQCALKKKKTLSVRV